MKNEKKMIIKKKRGQEKKIRFEKSTKSLILKHTVYEDELEIFLILCMVFQYLVQTIFESEINFIHLLNTIISYLV